MSHTQTDQRHTFLGDLECISDCVTQGELQLQLHANTFIPVVWDLLWLRFNR